MTNLLWALRSQFRTNVTAPAPHSRLWSLLTDAERIPQAHVPCWSWTEARTVWIIVAYSIVRIHRHLSLSFVRTLCIREVWYMELKIRACFVYSSRSRRHRGTRNLSSRGAASRFGYPLQHEHMTSSWVHFRSTGLAHYWHTVTRWASFLALQ